MPRDYLPDRNMSDTVHSGARLSTVDYNSAGMPTCLEQSV